MGVGFRNMFRYKYTRVPTSDTSQQSDPGDGSRHSQPIPRTSKSNNTTTRENEEEEDMMDEGRERANNQSIINKIDHKLDVALQ